MVLVDKILHRHQQTALPRSSAIKSLDYQRNQRSLIVTFTNGRQYQYGCVSPSTYRRLAHAESAGRFFQTQVRGRYPYRQLTDASSFSAASDQN